MLPRVDISCEGPECNSGISAHERESVASAGIPRGGVGLDTLRRIRGEVSCALAVTWHEFCGFGRGAAPLYKCTVCGHERQYGGSSLLAHNYEPARVS